MPISLYAIPSQLHALLRGYKRPLSAPAMRRQVGALLGYFMRHHSDHLADAAGGEWDMITTVPSSGNRFGTHPLVEAIRLVTPLEEAYVECLRRGPGELGHLRASDDGYVVRRRVEGRRILLVDDTFTSGARAQSAASALELAGATVAAVVPIGRVIDPDFKGDVSREYWARQTHAGFDWDECCLD